MPLADLHLRLTKGGFLYRKIFYPNQHSRWLFFAKATKKTASRNLSAGRPCLHSHRCPHHPNNRLLPWRLLPAHRRPLIECDLCRMRTYPWDCAVCEPLCLFWFILETIWGILSTNWLALLALIASMEMSWLWLSKTITASVFNLAPSPSAPEPVLELPSVADAAFVWFFMEALPSP